MPNYEYRCLDCRKRVSVYQSYAAYGVEPVTCPLCGGSRLERLLNRVRLLRSDEARLIRLQMSLPGTRSTRRIPRAMARMMRRMGQELGEEVPPEFDEIVGRMEAGESPEEIEEEFPDLGTGGEAGAEDEF